MQFQVFAIPMDGDDESVEQLDRLLRMLGSLSSDAA